MVLGRRSSIAKSVRYTTFSFPKIQKRASVSARTLVEVSSAERDIGCQASDILRGHRSIVDSGMNKLEFRAGRVVCHLDLIFYFVVHLAISAYRLCNTMSWDLAQIRSNLDQHVDVGYGSTSAIESQDSIYPSEHLRSERYIGAPVFLGSLQYNILTKTVENGPDDTNLP